MPARLMCARLMCARFENISWTNGQTMALVLWIGLGILSLSLLILMRTRWGHARPLSKCVGLSVLAHILLATYAYTTQLFYEVPVSPRDEVVQLTLIPQEPRGAAPREPEQPSPESWDQFASDTLPDVSETGEPRRSEVPVETMAERRAEPTAPQFTSTSSVDPGGPEEIERPEPPSPVRDASQLTRSVVQATKIEVPQAERQADPLPLPENQPLHRIRAAATETMPSRPDSTSPDLPENLFDMGSRVQRLADEALENAGEAVADLREDTRQANNGADSDLNASDPGPGLSASDDGSSSARASMGGVPATRLGDGQALPSTYQSRFAPPAEVRAPEWGNSAEAEAGVEAALAWLAAHQDRGGRWNPRSFGAGVERKVLGHDRDGAGAKADTGVTGLAILAFLGAGHTHFDGKYRRNVQHGLEFLISSQTSDGNLAGPARLYARMYCHSMATLAVSEAYALTGDHRLLPFVQRAVSYSVQAQDSTSGGWRYQPADPGDMSQFGWQVMALRSAELADIPIPTRTRQGMRRFLESCCRGQHDGLASYRPGHATSRAMTAEALACRYFLQPSHQEATSNPTAQPGLEQVRMETLLEASDYLAGELPGDGQVNLYYWYYATLALHQAVQHYRQAQDEDADSAKGDRIEQRWDEWNRALQQELLRQQIQNGSDAGSWNPESVWGNYGGRVYSTAMAALCLETYYRYLPLHEGD